MDDKTDRSRDVIRGEFFTDGEVFVLRLADSPVSGVGKTADAAFADLMRAEDAAGGLSQRLREIAADQAGETVRAMLIRWILIALIVFGAVGGALVGAMSLVPAVTEALSEARPGSYDQTRPQAPPGD